jgi:hypothetical protein
MSGPSLAVRPMTLMRPIAAIRMPRANEPKTILNRPHGIAIGAAGQRERWCITTATAHAWTMSVHPLIDARWARPISGRTDLGAVIEEHARPTLRRLTNCHPPAQPPKVLPLGPQGEYAVAADPNKDFCTPDTHEAPAPARAEPTDERNARSGNLIYSL